MTDPTQTTQQVDDERFATLQAEIEQLEAAQERMRAVMEQIESIAQAGPDRLMHLKIKIEHNDPAVEVEAAELLGAVVNAATGGDMALLLNAFVSGSVDAWILLGDSLGRALATTYEVNP